MLASLAGLFSRGAIVTLLVTQDVRGAAFPASEYGTECSVAAVSDFSCTCYGGADRRKAFLAAGKLDPNTVALDMGSYFNGGGLFFPILRGNASAEFFAGAGYEASGLAYRDYAAFAGTEGDADGTHSLAAHLARRRELDPSLPLAAVSNLDLSGTALEPHVAPYTVLPLSGGTELAVITLVDRTNLMAVNLALAKRVVGFRRALHVALAELRRRPGGMPAVVVLCLESHHRLELDYASRPDFSPPTGEGSGGNAEKLDGTGSISEDSWAVLRQLVVESDAIDVVLLSSVPIPERFTQPTTVQAWAGHHTLIVPGKSMGGAFLPYSKGGGGFYALNVTLALGANGRLLPDGSTAAAVLLDCDAPSDTVARSRLLQWHGLMDAQLGVVGYLDANGARAGDADPTGSCVSLPAGDACGCYVAECAAGNLVADAVRVHSGSDVALINGGSFRQHIPGGAVERRALLQTLPFLNELQTFVVSGATLRAALVNGLSNLANHDAITNPQGKFLQLSGVRVEWRIEDGAVQLVRAEVQAADGSLALLKAGDTYTVATNSFLAGNGDGFRFMPLGSITGLGVTIADAVAEYLGEIAPDAASALSVSVGERTVQLADRVRLRLGLFCAFDEGRVGERENCDHVHHVIAAINDKADGFLDHLLPYGIIEVNETVIGCNDPLLPRSGLAHLRAWAPDMVAAVGPQCSADLASVSSRVVRDALGHETVFISPDSTADSISDDDAFPRVVRLSPPERLVGEALAALVTYYNWQRVALLHDDSVWGSDSGAAFRAAFLGQAENGDLITRWGQGNGTHGAKIALAQCQAGGEVARSAASEWLDRLQHVQARVIVLAMHPECQRVIFEEAYESGRFMKDVAWLSTWVDEMTLVGSDGLPSASAIRGAVGIISVRPVSGADEWVAGSDSLYGQYMKLWAEASTTNMDASMRIERCTRSDTSAPSGGRRFPPFCDADGDASTFSTIYGMLGADAVIMFAEAMHQLTVFGGSSDFRSPAMLYEQLLTLQSSRSYENRGSAQTKVVELPVEGLSGRIRLSEAGDRLSTFTVINLQLIGDSDGAPLAASTGRRLEGEEQHGTEGRGLSVSVPVSSVPGLQAAFVSIGKREVEGLRFEQSAIFHGNTKTVPPDRTKPPTCGVDGLEEVGFWHVNKSEGCGTSTGHTLHFEWRGTVPGLACELPADIHMDCEYVPRQSAIVLSLSIIGLSVPIIALLWCAWRRSLEFGARKHRRTPPKTGQLAVNHLPASWKDVAVSVTDVWSGIGAAALLVGSLALSALPSVLGGRNTAARCTTVEVVEVIGPALVLFGVAACSPRHVHALTGQEDAPQKENDSLRNKKLETLLRRMWAVTQLMTTSLLILLCQLMAEWADDAQTTEVYETEAFVLVRATQQVRIPVNTTRCVMRPLQNDGITGPHALSLELAMLALALLALALLVQSARLSASRTDPTASLFTLCLHSIYVIYFWISTRDFDYIVRGIINCIVGWAGLIFQFGLPLYYSYRSAREELLVRLRRENEQGTERVEQVEKARGFDRELMMAMTFHEVRNPLNGTVGHLRLAKRLVAGMRRGDAVGDGGGATEAPEASGDGGGGEAGGVYGEGGGAGSGALRALEEEVDLSIVATELAVQYLGTLATLHGALTGSRELALAPTELTGLVRSVAAVVRPQLQPGVELRVEIPDADTHVMTDQMMLMQVLLNLVQNAARFTKHGFVCVRCAVVPAQDGVYSAKFAVLDSGTGMSNATKATLFDLYNSVGGIGIGMFLSSKLLSLLGSKIEVESPWRSQGPGSAFYFSVDMEMVSDASPGSRAGEGLAGDSMASVQEVQITVEPRAEIEELAAKGQAAAPSPSVSPSGSEPFESDLRVLIADDGQTNRRLLRRAFMGFFGQGWLVTEATTAEEALQEATSTEFALIVMDEIFAPGLEAMRGSAAITQLRAHEKQTGARRRAVIVSCTGNAHNSIVDLQNAGADLIWGKPMPNFTNGEMQLQLAPYLSASRTRQRMLP